MRFLVFAVIKIPRKIYHTFIYGCEYLYYRFLYSGPTIDMHFLQNRYLVFRNDHRKDVSKTFEKLFPDKLQVKIAEADLICEHIFDLLGSGPQKLSSEGDNYQPIDWHKDFKSGYKWPPRKFFRKIRHNYIRGVDIKVPWELSRFQHLNILGQTYLLTNEKKYLEEFVNQISDWIDNNPVGFGVNWTCTMDVAIRAVNWLVAMEYFADDSLLTKNFKNKFYNSIYEHGKFIRNHLERYSKFRNNHYIANLAGLFFIAVYCSFFKESRKWQKLAFDELCPEMENQVYPDGCSFEASTSYHRLVLEMFFYCSLLADRAGFSFPAKFRDRLKKMFEVTLCCMKPNGMIPQIGDNDSGRFLIFATRPILEHKYLLSLASIYFRDSSFKLPNFDFDEEAFWVFGISGMKVYNKLPIIIKSLVSNSFHSAGWFIIRHNNDYCFISCGLNGQNGKGGHAHNDKLSFELMIDGHDIIVDPGTYVYTPFPDERNRYRSTTYHNTFVVNRLEQNKLSEDLFSLADSVKILNAELTERDDKIVFQGVIQYSDITHKRIITLNKECCDWHITDSFSCSALINGRLIFHLSPNLKSEGNGILVTKETGGKIASIEVKGHNLENGKYHYSPEYGKKIKAECLFCNFSVMKGAQSINSYIRKA